MLASRRHVLKSPPSLTPRRLTGVLAAACAILVAPLAALAGTLSVKGTDMNGYGRVALAFEEPVKVQARTANGIVVLSFSKAVAVRDEKLVRELPAYIAQARIDPDGRGLRFALTGRQRVNILEAGEKVFVDLLPPNWVGLPPGLPPEVVEELARRAREAEARARAKRPETHLIRMRVARLPTLTRLVFELPAEIPARFNATTGKAELVVAAPAKLEDRGAPGPLRPGIEAVDAQSGDGQLTIRIALSEGYTAHGFREDDGFVVDVEALHASSRPSAEAAATARAEEPARAMEGKTPDGAARADSIPVDPQDRREPSPSPRPAAPSAALLPPGPVRAGFRLTPDALVVAFPFASRTPAAAFERAGEVIAVFHTPAEVALGELPREAETSVGQPRISREGAFIVVRFPLKAPRLARLSSDGNAWLLAIGETGVEPSEPIAPRRSVDEHGRSVVVLPLDGASGVHWMDNPQSGERIAVATAVSPARGLAKPYRFVEFQLLATAHGAAVAVAADDIIVRPGIDGIVVSRSDGLAVSSAAGEQEMPATPSRLVLERDEESEPPAGSLAERQWDLARALAEAPAIARSAARIDLALFLLRQGLNHEAAGLLAYATAADQKLATDRRALLLRGIALARARRYDEAHRILTAPELAGDGEAVLWRAFVDTRKGRWQPALVGFRQAQGLLRRYPDDLQALLRLALARAALEQKDFSFAERELAAAARLKLPAPAQDELAFLTARLDEDGQRISLALDAYRKLGETVSPVGAEARLRWLVLRLRENAMPADEAIDHLERLALVWRPSSIEAEALGHLGRLYARASRWNEAFATARRAIRFYPDNPVTRDLHEETARLFEEIFLTGKGQSLSRVQALALYFDFKEFTPIGRRGDEIVRRLSDRLVELDLLEQAGDLLQHQVDHRLTGAARSTVAARLATIRLMDGKPLQALQAIQSTRLPELPIAINRARLLLEARALSDLSRTDLALEVLEGERGADIDRLRADILWSGRRWREAGEAHEALLGASWQRAGALTDQERRDALRAAVAYSLSDERLSLDRLRAKFSAKMADSTDASAFAVATQPNVIATGAFRDIARSVTSADTLADFLAEYRKRYPDAAPPEREARPLIQAPEPMPRPQADGPAAAKGSS